MRGVEYGIKHLETRQQKMMDLDLQQCWYRRKKGKRPWHRNRGQEYTDVELKLSHPKPTYSIIFHIFNDNPSPEESVWAVEYPQQKSLKLKLRQFLQHRR